MTKKKTKKGKWFSPVRKSYLPCSWQGWVLYVPFIWFSTIPFQWIHDTWQQCNPPNIPPMYCREYPLLVTGIQLALLSVLYFAGLGVVMTWIARKKS